MAELFTSTCGNVRFGLTLLLVVSLSVFVLPRSSGAAGYTAEAISGAAPAEVPAAIREVLSDKGFRVNGPSGPLCEVWLRKTVPAKSASQQLGVVYGQIPEGTLVGVVRFPAAVKDYRQQSIKPGVYTLRYALLPQNGNHLGVSPNRDFLLATPAVADQKLATLPFEEVLTLSRKSAGSGHPSVWSLASPPEGASAAQLPKVAHQEDPDLWMVGFGLNLESGSASAAASPAVVWLVVAGHAPEA